MVRFGSVWCWLIAFLASAVIIYTGSKDWLRLPYYVPLFMITWIGFYKLYDLLFPVRR